MSRGDCPCQPRVLAAGLVVGFAVHVGWFELREIIPSAFRIPFFIAPLQPSTASCHGWVSASRRLVVGYQGLPGPSSRTGGARERAVDRHRRCGEESCRAPRCALRHLVQRPGGAKQLVESLRAPQRQSSVSSDGPAGAGLLCALRKRARAAYQPNTQSLSAHAKKVSLLVSAKVSHA